MSHLLSVDKFETCSAVDIKVSFNDVRQLQTSDKKEGTVTQILATCYKRRAMSEMFNPFHCNAKFMTCEMTLLVVRMSTGCAV